MAASKPTPKKRGRGSGKTYLPYDQAREFIRSEMIPSSSRYLDWWKINKPSNLPSRPARVYKEWVSWNDFLGTDNEFKTKSVTWRSLEEATIWAHKLNLASHEEWLEFVRDKTMLPSDIPARPDLVYKKNWQSWSHWLGNKPRQTLEAVQQAQKVHIYYAVRHPDVPDNVYTFGIETQGMVAFRERVQREKLVVAAMFWYESESAEIIKRIVTSLSTPYYGDDKYRIVPNIHEIVWHLQTQMETVRLG